MVPIRFDGNGLVRPSPAEIAYVTRRITAIRGDAARYDLVVWAEVASEPAELPELASPYADAGATWWIETAQPGSGWWEGVQARVAAGPATANPANARLA
jgi:hypothetical protein